MAERNVERPSNRSYEAGSFKRPRDDRGSERNGGSERDRGSERGSDRGSNRDRNERRRSRSPRNDRTRESDSGHRESRKEGRKDEKRDDRRDVCFEETVQKVEEEIKLDDDDVDALMMAMMGNDDNEAAEEEKRRKRREKLLAKAPEPKKSDSAMPIIQVEEKRDNEPNHSKSAAAITATSTTTTSTSTASTSTVIASATVDMGAEEKSGRDRSNSVGFDIFSTSPPQTVKTTNKASQNNEALQMMGDEAHLEDNWQDGEGYYITRIGEQIADRYQVRGALGKGVFSTVLSCIDRSDMDKVVAIKLIRNNDVMRKAAMKEVSILTEIGNQDPEDKKHCIRMLSTFFHRNHTAMVFDSYAMNLRETLNKFGRKVGINIKSVKAYAKQLLIALKHIASLRIVHADIKPDNILVSEDFRTIKLCDFGSAFKETDPDNDPTPYLQSRFYRAPEILLALEYNRQIDLWSVACCIYELFTGNIMFAGRDNNQMLNLHMQMKGRFANKTIKRHIASYDLLERLPHFTEDFRFRQIGIDKVTEKPVIRFVDINPQPVTNIKKTLLSCKAGADDQRLVIDAADLLEKMCSLEPEKRMQVRACLEHPFIKGPQSKANKGGEVI